MSWCAARGLEVWRVEHAEGLKQTTSTIGPYPSPGVPIQRYTESRNLVVPPKSSKVRVEIYFAVNSLHFAQRRTRVVRPEATIEPVLLEYPELKALYLHGNRIKLLTQAKMELRHFSFQTYDSGGSQLSRVVSRRRRRPHKSKRARLRLVTLACRWHSLSVPQNITRELLPALRSVALYVSVGLRRKSVKPAQE